CRACRSRPRRRAGSSGWFRNRHRRRAASPGSPGVRTIGRLNLKIASLRARSWAMTAGAAVVAAATYGVLHGAQSQGWPPPVTPGTSMALSAEESLATIVVPPGYRAELVAREPMVIDPILAEFDADGRLWVLEMPGFAMDMSMADSREPICRLVVLEDDNDDGVMDRRTVFVDDLILPRAL